MHKLLTFSLAVMLSTSAFATNNTIFSCTTDNGKQVTITKAGSDYQFSYDNTQFRNAIKTVIADENTYVASGSGFITNSLAMKNKGTTYTVQFVQVRNNPKVIDDATLYIEKGNNQNSVACNTKKPVTQHFDYKLIKNL